MMIIIYLSMKQDWSVINGFSLVEVLLAVALLGMIATGFGSALLYGQEGQRIAGERARAVLLAEEGLEAVRNIRDSDYSALVAGTHGLAISAGKWELVGSLDTTGIFSRQLIVSDIDENRKQVTSTVTWQQNLQREGSVQLVTYLTNWADEQGNGLPSEDSCEAYCVSEAYTTGVCRQNATQCRINDETYEAAGDSQCSGHPASDTCCCGL